MRRRKLVKRRRLIERYLGQRQGRVLDVGCATGLFLREMSQAGWQAAGIEPIASAADFARRRFGLDVFQGMLGEAAYESESFDVVTLWDVLEHTFSPSTELVNAARLLRPGGLLALSVPNWDSPDRWIFGRHWQGLDSPRHLFVFTRDSLTRLLTQAGFSILAWVCFIPSYFSFVMSVQRWLETINPPFSKFTTRVLNIPGVRFPFEPWFTLNSWLGKGAIISVFARKTGEPQDVSAGGANVQASRNATHLKNE
jgi:SAM-dependent methyltransferase